MDSITIALFLAAILLEIIAIFIYSFHKSRYNLMVNTETSKITTIVRAGIYEAKGKIKGDGEKLTSPIGNQPCVYYKLRIEELRKSGKSSHWHTIVEDEKHVPFSVDDHSGIARIDIKGAKLKLKTDSKGRTGFLKESSMELKNAMKKYGMETKGWLFEKTLRYTETYICDGDELYVLGEVNEFDGYYPIFRKKDKFLFVSDSPEEKLVKTSKIISQVALAVILIVPVVAGIVYYLGSD